jgi:hypothetical protein
MLDGLEQHRGELASPPEVVARLVYDIDGRLIPISEATDDPPGSDWLKAQANPPLPIKRGRPVMLGTDKGKTARVTTSTVIHPIILAAYRRTSNLRASQGKMAPTDEGVLRQYSLAALFREALLCHLRTCLDELKAAGVDLEAEWRRDLSDEALEAALGEWVEWPEWIKQTSAQKRKGRG